MMRVTEIKGPVDIRVGNTVFTGELVSTLERVTIEIEFETPYLYDGRNYVGGQNLIHEALKDDVPFHIEFVKEDQQ